MPFTFNGNTPNSILYNSNTVNTLIYNGTTVWTSGPAPTPAGCFYVTPSATYGTSATTGLHSFSRTSGQPAAISLQYMIEHDGEEGEWAAYTVGTDIALNYGDKLYFKGNNDHFSTDANNYYRFKTDGYIDIGGDLTYLLSVNGNVADISGYGSRLFNQLFRCPSMSYSTSSANVIDASNLVLPSTTIGEYAYSNLFAGSGMNTGNTLVYAPKSLPATTLGSYCYNYMFCGCADLKTVPKFPSTNITASSNMCINMFARCSSLHVLPDMSHILIDSSTSANCFKTMFRLCTGIKLSTIAVDAYVNTFSFSQAPTASFAQDMFRDTGGAFVGTPGLQTYYTYNEIDKDVTELCIEKLNSASGGVGIFATSGAPHIEAYYKLNDGAWTAYTVDSYISMQQGDKIYFKGSGPMGVSDAEYNYFRTNNPDNIRFKVSGDVSTLLDPAGWVEDTGVTIYTLTSLFSGFPVTDASDLILPATSTTQGAFSHMFENCEYLMLPPKALRITEMGSGTCYQMFNNCASLITVPKMRTAILNEYCYSGMFSNCGSLTALPKLYAETSAESCYQDMFCACSEIMVSDTQSSAYTEPYTSNFELDATNADGMFMDTSGEVSIPTGTQFYTSNQIVS